MKFRTDKINLTELLGITTNAGTEAWLTVPIGTTEGFVTDLQQWRGNYDDDDPDEKRRGQPKDPGGRHGNVMLLDRIVEWNLDDDEGNVMPLPRTITVESEAVKKRAKKANVSLDEAVYLEKVDIIRQLPIELFLELAGKMMNTKALNERAEAFSKTSSEPSSSTIIPLP